MPDKKVIDLMDLIHSNLDGEFEWISSTAFLPPEGTPAASSHQVKAARMLGDALIALLNQSTVDPKPYKSIKVKVAGPARVATREELDAEALPLDKLHQVKEQIDRINEKLDRLPTNAGLASTAVRLEGNIDHRNTETVRKLADDIRKELQVMLDGSTVERTDRTRTMSGKGLFWYDPVADRICEGSAKPAGPNWKPLIQPKPGLSVEEIKKFANTAPIFGYTYGGAMPTSVEDRVAKNVEAKKLTSEAETIRKVQDKEVWHKGYAAGRRDELDAGLRSNTGALPVHLDYWVPEGSAKHIAQDYATYRGTLAGIIDMGLRSPMSANDMDRLLDLIFDNYDSFTEVLGRYGELMTNLAKHALFRESTSGGLRKQLGLGK